MAQRVNISRFYAYDLEDIAVAFYRIAKERYGDNCLQGPRVGLFSGQLALVLGIVKTGLDTEEYGIRGLVCVSNLAHLFQVGGGNGEPVVTAIGVHPRKQTEVESFLSAIQEHLEKASIYKGKAVTASKEFMDLSNEPSGAVVYGDAIKRELEAHVWSLITRAEICENAGIPPRRKVLFVGPYGSGKTLTAFLTAQIAVQHGWTFIYMPPTQENANCSIDHVYEFAKRYQPSVVFIEDIEREQRYDDKFVFGRIMNIIDGIETKNVRILTVMTTNRQDKVAGGMQRPGRIDKIIDFGNYTKTDAVALLQKHIPQKFLNGQIDWEKVGIACEEFAPAFVCEVAISAKLLAISECEINGVPHITAKLLIDAANSLRSQHEKCSEVLGFHK